MKIQFRQGLVSALGSFLTAHGSYVDLNTNGGATIARASVAFRDGNYLIEERSNVSNAWGPFAWNSAWGTEPGSWTAYLYWDVSIATGTVTRGFTPYAVVSSSIEPVSPAVDQHWFDKTDANQPVMKYWDGEFWRMCARVFAGTRTSAGVVASASPGGLINLWPGESSTWPDHGYILYGLDLKGIRYSNGVFVTTASPIETFHGAFSSPLRMELSTSTLIAEEVIPAFSAVSNTGSNSVILAHGTIVDKRPVGVVLATANAGDPVDIVTNGIVTNDAWDWNVSLGRDLYCGTSGELVQGMVAAINDSTRIGTILGPRTIIVDIDLYGVSNSSITLGPTGAAGFSGYSGKSGFSGYSGTSGFSGASTSGYSGISGFSGASTSGYSGTAGSTGTSGYSGTAGSGTSGYSGSTGTSGYSGTPANPIPSAVLLSLPSAATIGSLLHVSDANTGAGTVAFANGTNWIDIKTGVTVV